MRIIYTNHAKFKIEKLKIPRVWIEETFKSPDLIITFGDKFIINRKLNGKTLEIVYIKAKYIRVVTLYFLR
ncbi:MAG: DUF4258 domain-containing protein [Candidatus Nanoarchaeia archaeon]|nr:DUF4258 domain-containing protein [Candidatus Nanoarchaeia archaeon]